MVATKARKPKKAATVAIPGTPTVVRCIHVPVAEVLGYSVNRKFTETEGWKEFDAAVRLAWKEVTQLANQAMMELLRHDPGFVDGKLAKYPPFAKDGGVYLYELCKDHQGSLSAKSYSNVLRYISDKYVNNRFASLGRGDRVVDSHRYPQAYPVHNQDWKMHRDDSGAFILEFPLGGKRWKIRLHTAGQPGGDGFHRQRKQLEQILTDNLKCCEMRVAGKRVRGSANNHKNTANGNSGSGRSMYRTMIHLVARFPVKECTATKTMLVCTDPNAFWVWEVDGVQARPLNADHIKGWIEVHRCYLQRMSEDMKPEKRWNASHRKQMLDSRAKRCEKQNRRLNTFCDQASAMLVKFAERNQVATVTYDDTTKSYLESFPWENVRTKLARKLKDVGIKFIHLNAPKKGAKQNGEE